MGNYLFLGTYTSTLTDQAMTIKMDPAVKPQDDSKLKSNDNNTVVPSDKPEDDGKLTSTDNLKMDHPKFVFYQPSFFTNILINTAITTR